VFCLGVQKRCTWQSGTRGHSGGLQACPLGYNSEDRNAACADGLYEIDLVASRTGESALYTGFPLRYGVGGGVWPSMNAQSKPCLLHTMTAFVSAMVVEDSSSRYRDLNGDVRSHACRVSYWRSNPL